MTDKTITIQLHQKDAELMETASKGSGLSIGEIIGYMVQKFKDDLKGMAAGK
jgi:hypothetical protein